MTQLPLLALAVTLFASTNIDDLVVLIGFFTDRRLRARDIVAGQFAGMSVLFLLSASGALLSLVTPKAFLGLLGIVPIAIGIRNLSDLRPDAPDPQNTPQKGVVGVALVTIANGGDNLGIYIPAFAVHSGGEIGFIAVVFVAMTALWCVLAHWMVNHSRFGAPLRRYGHILAPMVLIGLGIVTIYKAGSIGWLLRHTTD